MGVLNSTPLPDRPNVALLARPIVLLADGATEPPAEIRLFPAGFVETTKGTFQFDDASCSSVSRHFSDLGRMLHFDYEHASVTAMLAPDPAEAGKAAGQFKVECRNGECWATDIRWTPKAREKIVAREFLYTSPTFCHDEEGRVLEILSCALTNDPAIKRREPLMASREAPKEQSMKSLLARLGLSETASEAEGIVSLTKIQESLSSLLTLTAKTTAAEALGVIQGWKVAAEQATALSAKVAELEKASADRELEDVIRAAKTSGRLSPAAEKLARNIGATAGVAALSSFLEALPQFGGGEHRDSTPGSAPAAPSPSELEIARLCGNKPEAVAAYRATRAGK